MPEDLNNSSVQSKARLMHIPKADHRNIKYYIAQACESTMAYMY